MLTVQNLPGQIETARSLFHGGHAMAEDLASYLEEKKQVTADARAQWMKNHWRLGKGDRQMEDEFADAWITSVDKDVLAHMFTLAFFQLVTLQPNEWPIIKTDSRDGTLKCWITGEQNGTPRHQFIPRGEHQAYLLDRYTSEDVEGQLYNLQTGDVSEQDKMLKEMVYEFDLGIDAMGRALLDSAAIESGLRAYLSLHSSVVEANVPDANAMDLSAADEGLLTVAKLKEILDYFERFASDVELDQTPLTIRAIFMSSQNARDVWDFPSEVAGYSLSGALTNPKDALPESMKTTIWQSGKINSLFGYPVNLVSRNTIAAGTMFVASNKPMGFYFTKPSMAEVYREEKRRQNRALMAMSRVHKFVQPDEWAHRYLKVTL